MTPEEQEHLVKTLEEFDPSDLYHAGDHWEPGYYSAIDRAIALIRGEINHWTSPRAKR